MLWLVDFCTSELENHIWDPHGNIAQRAVTHCYQLTEISIVMKKLTRKTETSMHYKPRCTTVKSTSRCSNET